MSLLNLENDQTAWKPAACSRLSDLPERIHGAFIHRYIKVILHAVYFIFSLGYGKRRACFSLLILGRMNVLPFKC